MESPPGSDYEDYEEPQESRVSGARSSNKKSVSFRDGHDEYRPVGLLGNGGGNRGRDGQRQPQVS